MTAACLFRPVLFAMLVLASSSLVTGWQRGQTPERLLDDLTSESPDIAWLVVNDTVMGGRSVGKIDRDPDGLRFRGRTNTDGGGFSSIRASNVALDLGRYDGFRLRLRGDGRRYTWRLTTDARWLGREISYWADFETEANVWREVDVPFSRFRPTYRGSNLDGPPLDPGRISGMGLMIYDGNDGPFELSLSRIEAFRSPGAETNPSRGSH